MTLSNESRKFFTKLSKVWQNYKDYAYLDGINLSPEQINIVEQDEDQLLIEGYAGTGKSLTLLYKFINVLVREENKKVLFVTYNSTLIEDTLKRLGSCKEYLENKDKHDAQVLTFHQMATDILKQIRVIDKGMAKLNVDRIKKFNDSAYRRLAGIVNKYTDKSSEVYKNIPVDEKLYSTHNIKFIVEEITWIKAMGFIKLDKYMSTERTGRSKSIRLTRNQRKTVFKIFEEYQKELESRKFGESLDLEDYALKILENDHLLSDEIKYDYIFVDEVQDLDPMQIRALCKLTKKSIVLSGDAKQRIYKKCPIKYEELGLMIKQKGKRKLLNKNYRSTAQIVTLANELKFTDLENKVMKLTEKQFIKDGERPIIKIIKGDLETVRYLVRQIKSIQQENPLKTIAIVRREEVRSKTGYKKSPFRLKLEQELCQRIIDMDNYYHKSDTKKEKQIFYTNAYDIKGLEFDVVFILDFNNAFYPYSKEIKNIREKNESKDEKLINDDVLEFINNEKKLMYVAMTRAKEKLFIIANGCSSTSNISEFIFDFKFKDYKNDGFVENDIIKAKTNYMHIGNGKLYIEREKAKEEKVIKDINGSLEMDTSLNLTTKDKKSTCNNIIIKLDINKNNAANINNYDNILSNVDKVDTFIKPFLNKNKIKFIDNRSKKGAFWVLGGLEINNIMKSFGQYGFTFVFRKEGGKASKNKPAWYLIK